LSLKYKKAYWAKRFRGLLPVVIDVETSGLNPITDSLLEIALVTLSVDKEGRLQPDQKYSYHIEPFQGANLDPNALEITGIDPFCPLRYAIPEQQALHNVFLKIKAQLGEVDCQRAVLVGHNAWFDLAFIQASRKRCGLRSIPLHSFTTIDTASLSAVALGETVLAKALRRACITFDVNQAHSALYDATKTAELFCYLLNQWVR
jgi:ribonuclease T